MPRNTWKKCAGCALLVLSSFALLGFADAQAGPDVLLPPEQILRWQPHDIDELARPFGLPLAPDVATAAPARRPAVSHTLDGRWSEIGPPPRTGAVIGFDPNRREVVLFGGGEGRWALASVWTLALGDPEPRWIERTVTGDVMPAGSTVMGTFDAAHRRLIALVADSVMRVATLSLDVGAHWTLLPATGAPPARQRAAVAYDPVADAVVMHGGELPPFGPATDEVWRCSLSGAPAWSRAMPGGAPVAAAGHGMAYDPARERMVMLECAGTPFLSNFPAHGSGDWARIPVSTFFCESSSRAVVDSAADELLIAYADGATEAFSLSDGARRDLTPFGSGGRRTGEGLLLDVAGGRLLRVGGGDAGRSFTQASIEAVPTAGGEWSAIAPYAPGPRFWHTGALDGARHRWIVYGGSPYGLGDTVVTLSLAPGGGWAPIHPLGPSPRLRFGQAFTWDPDGDRMLLFGGQATDGTGDYLDDLWGLSLSDPPRWTPILPIVPGAPGPHRHSTLLWDGPRHRLLAFGGDDGTKVLPEVWQGVLAGDQVTWTNVTPPGGLPFAYASVFAIPGTDEAWAVGFPGTLWRIPLDRPIEFTAIPTGGLELPMGFQLVGLDTRRARLLGVPPVFEGATRGSFESLWSLSLTGGHDWQAQGTLGAAPPPRFLQAAAYDPVQDRLLVHGGYDDDMEYFGDTWAVQWDEPVPVQVALVEARSGADGVWITWQVGTTAPVTVQQRADGFTWSDAATLAPDGEGRVAFHGPRLAATEARDYRLALDDGLARIHAGEVALRGVPAAGLQLAGARTNPCAGDLVVRLLVPGAERAELALLDVSGRRLAQRVVAATDGEQHVRLAARGDVPPGLYFIRLRRGAEERLARVAVIR